MIVAQRVVRVVVRLVTRDVLEGELDNSLEVRAEDFVVAGLALSSGLAGCNPDFNYAVAGVVTRWTPVKNLTFSADLAYAMLDQKYASGSTVTLPQQAGIAKPAAGYELKDQGALTLLLRAQRVW